MSNFVALVVEDDVFQRECLADLLKSAGLEVVECSNGEAAELVLASTGPELRALVTDVKLDGEISGVQLAQYAKRKFPAPIGTKAVITMCNCRYLCRAVMLCANWASVRLRFGP
jgi:CheY-like chemotaxis protein